MKKGFIDIEVSKLIKAEWNYKKENEELSKKLLANFKEYGQVENIQVRKLGDKYEVVNGNHRLDVMIELGMKKCHAYNHGEITLQQAQLIAIATNETKFDSDALVLGELLEKMSDDIDIEEMAKTLPFDEKEIESMIDVLTFDWEQFEEDKPLDLEEEDKFDNIIKLKVPIDTYKRWLELKQRMLELNGYDNESKVFEFAVIEALNIPIESLD